MMMQKTLKRCSSMSLAETIAEYEDILIEILVRLPARPLVRFKCVSKRWLSLISDPMFRRRHTLRHPRPSISAFFTPNSGTQFLHQDIARNRNFIMCKSFLNPLNSVDSSSPYDGIEIVQSCNGLFLCRPQYPHSSHPTTASSLVFYVLNPTTNDFRSLTPPAAAAVVTTPYRVFGHVLAFDPSISPHYKVFFLWFVNPQHPLTPGGTLYHRIEIYSSETRSWRLLDSIHVAHPLIEFRLGAYFNGALLWAGHNCEVSYYHIDEDRVGHFDGLPENYGKYTGTVVSRYFRESPDGTHLHLIDIQRSESRKTCLTKLQVFEMGKDFSGWSIKYNVDLHPLCAAYPQLLQDRFVVLSFAAADEENAKDDECSSLLLHSPRKVITYNIRNNTFKFTEVTERPDRQAYPFVMYKTNFHYIESLAVV